MCCLYHEFNSRNNAKDSCKLTKQFEFVLPIQFILVLLGCFTSSQSLLHFCPRCTRVLFLVFEWPTPRGRRTIYNKPLDRKGARCSSRFPPSLKWIWQKNKHQEPCTLLEMLCYFTCATGTNNSRCSYLKSAEKHIVIGPCLEHTSRGHTKMAEPQTNISSWHFQH